MSTYSQKSTGSYLEDYLDSIAHMPAEIKRNFELMRELDKKQHLLMKEMNEKHGEYINEAKKKIGLKDKSATTEELKQLILNQEELDLICKCRDDAINKSDEKVAVAGQTYELVDNYIRELDITIGKFEDQLRSTGDWDDILNASSITPALKKQRSSGGGGKGFNTSEIIAGVVQNAVQSAYRGSSRGRSAESGGIASVGGGGNAGGGTTLLSTVSGGSGIMSIQNHLYQHEEIPTDPSEPLYCTCKRVSFGEMIGCDDEECMVEWFHYECVGLTEPPKGKWFCAGCIARRKKKEKKN